MGGKMTKLIVSQIALTGLDKHDLIFLKGHRDLICVIPIEVNYDGQSIDLNMFTRDDLDTLSRFYGVMIDANPKKFSVDFPNVKNLRESMIELSMRENDNLIYLPPSEAILAGEFDKVREDIIAFTLESKLNFASINLHSISNAYAKRIKSIVTYLARYPQASLGEICNEAKRIQRQEQITQYLYVPNRKMAYDAHLQNFLKHRRYSPLRLIDRRGSLIIIDNFTYDGRLLKADPTADDIVRIISDGKRKLQFPFNEQLSIHIHETDETPMSKEIRDKLAQACPDTSIACDKNLSLDPITTICAGYGSILFEIRKV